MPVYMFIHVQHVEGAPAATWQHACCQQCSSLLQDTVTCDKCLYHIGASILCVTIVLLLLPAAAEHHCC
jgi:hypothetical protein